MSQSKGQLGFSEVGSAPLNRRGRSTGKFSWTQKYVAPSSHLPSVVEIHDGRVHFFTGQLPEEFQEKAKEFFFYQINSLSKSVSLRARVFILFLIYIAFS